MDALNRKELAQLIKLLRKNGVESFKTPQIELKLHAELPRKLSRKNQSDKIETNAPSEEQTLFWSSAQADLPGVF